MNKVWYITNVTEGFFIKLIIQLLHRGDKVVATSHYKDVLTQKISFESDDFLPLEMDICNESEVKKSLELATEKFGKLDCVVTNSSYGRFGFIEDYSNQLAKTEIEQNVLGTLNILRQVLPYLRQQRSGHIFNFASISGFVSGPGSGIHSASMFSISAISETLNYELKPFHIHVTNVMHSFFNSDNPPVKYIYTEYSYEESRKRLYKKRVYTKYKEDSNLSKGVKSIIKVSEMKDPPQYLFLGANANVLANAKIAKLKSDIEMFKQVI